MRYVRTYRFSASHFNSRKTYEKAWLLEEQEETIQFGQYRDKGQSLPDAVLAMLTDIHGHNFKIVVTFESPMLEDDGWLVDDVETEKVVMEWSGINLSMHRDFLATKERATTELMASKLLDKLERFNAKSVCVYETDDIYAEAP